MKGLQHRVQKILRFKYLILLQRLNSFTVKFLFSRNDLPLSLETLLELNVFISRVVKREYTEPGLMKDGLQEYLIFHRHGEI